MNPPENVWYYLRQPSTWRGLVTIAASLGLFSLSAGAQEGIVQAAILVVAASQAVCGAINVVRDENKLRF